MRQLRKYLMTTVCVCVVGDTQPTITVLPAPLGVCVCVCVRVAGDTQPTITVLPAPVSGCVCVCVCVCVSVAGGSYASIL